MRLWCRAGLGVVLGLAGAVGVSAVVWLRVPGTGAVPRPVPGGDVEIAWLHIPTAYEAWDNFVRGVKRAEQPGVVVDHSAAYPEITTAVPEVVVRRDGVAGAVRLRWYKVTDSATLEDWVAALARRDPPPLAVVGGWSSDRAISLAEALRDADWRDRRPLYFLTQATADQVAPGGSDPVAPGGSGPVAPPLISLYPRSFRLCFTNRQMARAVTDFVLSDPSLCPGPVLPAGLRTLPLVPAGGWAVLVASAAETHLARTPSAGFAVRWEDDPYSKDLSFKFREEFRRQMATAGLPELQTTLFSVPFSTGRMNRANPAEAQVAEEILARLPPPDRRAVVIVPTVSAPARRTLEAVVRGNPSIGRRLVAVTGDGLSVNTFFRDREYAWPIRALPVPFVLFTHDHPFRWDRPDADPPPPPGYELPEPKPGTVYSSSEDVQLYNRLARMIIATVFPDDRPGVLSDPEAVADRLHRLDPPFFDVAGNRRDDTGEHIVLVRPVFPGDGREGRDAPEGTLEVFTRFPGRAGWQRIHLLQLGRNPVAPADR